MITMDSTQFGYTVPHVSISNFYTYVARIFYKKVTIKIKYHSVSQ